MINEEWSTESPGNTPDLSFLPEGLRDFATPNSMVSRPTPGYGLTVEHEVNHVISNQKGLSDQDIQFAKSVASDPIDTFYSWLVIRGEKPRRSDISSIWFSDSINQIIDKMKDVSKRGRPYWISKEVNVIPGTEVSSYSYPSGHAILSWMIAKKLAIQYPHLSDGLFSLADRISRSRVHAGVHFPSDIAPAKEIADRLIYLVN